MVSWNSASYVHDFNPSGAETERFLDNWVNTVAVNALALVYLGPHDQQPKFTKRPCSIGSEDFPRNINCENDREKV